MIRKQSTFIDPSVRQCDPFLFEQVSSLEKGLQRLALDFSIFDNTPWKKIKDVFVETGTQQYPLSDRHYAHFTKASTTARRSEALLRAENHGRRGFYLVLTLKFFYKEDPKCFLEWEMIFDRDGRVIGGGTTGHDEIGLLVTA